MIIKPAIVCVGYNRKESIIRLVESVSNAYFEYDDINLIISLDYSEKQKEIEESLSSIEWKYGKKRIIKHASNLGLKNHILKCGDLSHEYGAVIILEDDLVVSKNFYDYSLQAMNYYSNNEKVCGIGLYSHSFNGYAKYPFIPKRNEYDTYFGQFSITWGQCWSENQWNSFKRWYILNKDNELFENADIPSQIKKWGKNSWGKYFVNYIVENDLFYVVPYCSLSTNCSEIGEHSKNKDLKHQTMLLDCLHKEYKFPTFKEGIKYDIFFERIFDSNILINDIDIKDIGIDFYGKHKYCTKKEYVLTCQKYKAKEIACYELEFRPVEQNVEKLKRGKGIYLYKTKDIKLLNPEIKNAIEFFYFDIFDNFRFRDLLYILIGKFLKWQE